MSPSWWLSIIKLHHTAPLHGLKYSANLCSSSLCVTELGWRFPAESPVRLSHPFGRYFAALEYLLGQEGNGSNPMQAFSYVAWGHSIATWCR